jgi:hypothetical protein
MIVLMRERTTQVSLLLCSAILLIAVVHYIASFRGWYDIYDWIDIPLHLMGGAFIGILFYYLFTSRFDVMPRHSTIDLVPLLIFGAGFVALVGVLWEFYEFFADVVVYEKYAPFAFPGYVHGDTLLDLLNDIAGGTLALALLWFGFERKK